MTFERYPLHERWLLDHDHAIATHAREMSEIRATLAETSALQQRQSAMLLALSDMVVRLLERWDEVENNDGLEP